MNTELIDILKEHQKIRFKELEKILDKIPEKEIIIISGYKDYNQTLNTLGSNIPLDTNDSILENLNKLIKDFKKKYKNLYIIHSDVGTLGNILNINRYISVKKQDDASHFQINLESFITEPSNKVFHIWNANEKNWNKELNQELNNKKLLEYLSDSFKFDHSFIKDESFRFDKQIFGMFGIATYITDPNIDIETLKNNLFQKDKTYYKYLYTDCITYGNKIFYK